MPFCSTCARYWTPTAMDPDGSCPMCHRPIDAPPNADDSAPLRSRNKIDVRALAAGTSEEDVSAPWHFKVLVGGLVLYLGWRVVALFI
jgi:hypothetical protein